MRLAKVGDLVKYPDKHGTYWLVTSENAGRLYGRALGVVYPHSMSARPEDVEIAVAGALDQLKAIISAKPAPIPKVLPCPECGFEHVDGGIWATTRLHKTHQCQNCKHEWRPFEYPTVGIASGSMAVQRSEGVAITAPQQPASTEALLTDEDSVFLREIEKFTPYHGEVLKLLQLQHAKSIQHERRKVLEACWNWYMAGQHPNINEKEMFMKSIAAYLEGKQ